MDWAFVIGLGAIALVVIGAIIYFGRKLFWGVCIIAFELAPKSAFGAFLGTTDGVLIVIFGSIFFYVIAGVILEGLGYPIARRSGRGT